MRKRYDIPVLRRVESRRRSAMAASLLAADLLITACGGNNNQRPVDNRIGYDVSHPQCVKDDQGKETADPIKLPQPAAFAVVGLTGGNAAASNPCFQKLYEWARQSSGKANRQPVSFYVNTAAPGPVSDGKPVPNWPTKGSNRVGVCIPQAPLSNACAYQYGINTANQDLAHLPHDAAKDVEMWMDVEQNGTTWQLDHNLNVVVLQGMARTFVKAGHPTGIYSSRNLWESVAGGVPITGASSLYGLDSWISGPRTLEEAKAQCGQPGFASGRVVIAQIQQKGQIDQDYSCP